MCNKTLRMPNRKRQTCHFFPLSINRSRSLFTLPPKNTQTLPHLPPPQQTLLPPTLPLLLPRTLAIPKRKPARPLIRSCSLAHPRRIAAKQQRPGPEAKQHRVADQSGRESKTPPAAHHLRVQVERRDGLESHRDRSSSFADFVLGGDAGAARGEEEVSSPEEERSLLFLELEDVDVDGELEVGACGPMGITPVKTRFEAARASRVRARVRQR